MEAAIISVTENSVNINITPDQPIVKVLSGYAIAFGGIINPMTTFGDMIYADVTPGPARLPGNITAVKNFLNQTGNGTISAAPTWSPLIIADIPDLSSVYQTILPSQTGNALKFLTTNGTSPSWGNNFTWDATNTRLIFGPGNSNSQGSYNFILGLNSTISIGSWNTILGESNTIDRPSGSSGVGNNGIFAGYQNYITTTSANPFLGSYSTVIIGGTKNKSIDGTQSVIIGGNNNLISARSAIVLGGEWGEATGYGSVVHGKQDNAGPDATPIPTQRVLASGTGAINISTNDNSQTIGHGALAERSIILGGRNGNVPADATGSGILGGDGIKARAGEAHQWYLPNLNITDTPSNDDSLVQILVRNASTGQIKYRNASSIGSALPSVNTGDILYGSATNVWSKLSIASAGNVLLSGTTPSWGKVNLSTHVTGQLPDLYSIGGDKYVLDALVNPNNYTSATSSRIYAFTTFTTSTYSVWKPKIEFTFQVSGDGGGREQIYCYTEYSTDNVNWTSLGNDTYITTDAHAHTLVTITGIHNTASVSTLYYYRLNTSNSAGGNSFYSIDYGCTITTIPI